MGRNIQDIINALPQADRTRVRARSKEMAREMIEYAESLDQLRRAAGKTQAELAEKLGVKQHAISQLERRSDLYLSTLNKYVGALGHRLELALVKANGERVRLPNLRPWEANAEPGPEPRAAAGRRPDGIGGKTAKPDRAQARAGELKKGASRAGGKHSRK